MTRNDIKIYDNFLKYKDFIELKKTIIHPDFPWFFNPYKVHVGDGNVQFTHLFYSPESKSEYFSCLNPILSKLDFDTLIRIKSNIVTKTNNRVYFPLHVDAAPKFKYKIVIFYINTNDGFTFFEDGTKIESIENRLVLFDGELLHSGTTCTDENYRIVINFNFI